MPPPPAPYLLSSRPHLSPSQPPAIRLPPSIPLFSLPSDHQNAAAALTAATAGGPLLLFPFFSLLLLPFLPHSQPSLPSLCLRPPATPSPTLTAATSPPSSLSSLSRPWKPSKPCCCLSRLPPYSSADLQLTVGPPNPNAIDTSSSVSPTSILETHHLSTAHSRSLSSRNRSRPTHNVARIFWRDPVGVPFDRQRFLFLQFRGIQSAQIVNVVDGAAEPAGHCGSSLVDSVDVAAKDNLDAKRKKLKGKRAVVRWLKFFRWKKKKEYKRMTAEEKILFKLRKAQKKEERLVHCLNKIVPKESCQTTHDPEVLTPEEHFFFLKKGLKCKNYVPVGRRGIYQGVILNMHLHWKKHQTLKVIVKTFTAEEVKEIAAELARLSGGIVLDIHEDNTIIMYRGKNYSQPPTEIMSPRCTLPRKKALDKSKYRDALRAVRNYIPRLEQDLVLLQTQSKGSSVGKIEAGEECSTMYKSEAREQSHRVGCDGIDGENSDKLRKMTAVSGLSEEDPFVGLDVGSGSEALYDVFDTDSESESVEQPVYLKDFESIPTECDSKQKFLVECNEGEGNVEEHLSQITLDSESKCFHREDELHSFDEVDKIFLRAVSLLKKKNR